ncbi:hypothetical protein [Breznakiella homolactica]|uniref:DUF3784 domain-containing protein n=1 Tax=Breznakiella homolactica TaxID=2798577 RepID=A0A7T7XPD4_9SPIR|nr:hypothetical protein [Breznakiella homolactica]QQO09937.1 hypothetical protein JFL75_03220 [Breznakiella homolactica]
MLYIGLGVLVIFYGIYTAVIRLKSPEKLGKYQAMKERYGDNTGKLLHVLSYTVVPIILGAVLICRAVFFSV